MSFADFQRAFAELVADPGLCRAVACGEVELPAHDTLTPREVRRLHALVAQPGMRTNWALYRSNRFGPIHTVLHGTCALLGDQLRELLDAYWRSAPAFPDLPFAEEARRFVDFVTRTSSDKIRDFDRVRDVMRLELAINDAYSGETAKSGVQYDSTARGLRVELTHEPTMLLSFLAGEAPAWSEARRGKFVLCITQNDIFEVATEGS